MHNTIKQTTKACINSCGGDIKNPEKKPNENKNNVELNSSHFQVQTNERTSK